MNSLHFETAHPPYVLQYEVLSEEHFPLKNSRQSKLPTVSE